MANVVKSAALTGIPTTPRVLRIGLKGADVKELQGRLGLVPDGYFGPSTLAAVISFQAAHKLTADGLVGPGTRLEIAKEELALPIAPPVVYRTLAEIHAHLEKGSAAYHEACYRILAFDAGTEKRIVKAANQLLKLKTDYYLPFEELTGIPWVITAGIHSMECNNNPKGCLHNGQAIVGLNRKTSIVPVGRGPFNKFKTLTENWLAAAKDAVSLIPMWHQADWTVGTMLKVGERFNGLGYISGAGKKEESPYIYACTNINDGHGKYVRDGVFDPAADANAQVGMAATFKQLENMGEFKPTFLA